MKPENASYADRRAKTNPVFSSQARSVPARERLPAFRTELNGIERRERIAGAEKYVARSC